MRDSAPYSRPIGGSTCTMEGLLYFIWEREVIRIVKERGGDKPWTKDPILGKYKFTNIRRKDDRVSKWIVNNIIEPNKRRDDLWFILLVTRLINWPPTLQHLINDGVLFDNLLNFNPEKFSFSVENFKNTGSKVYSGAYMVYPTKMDPGGVKSLAIAKHIIKPAAKIHEVVEEAVFEERSIESFVARLSTSFGISTFMAGQVAADLTYCDQLATAKDLYTYAPIGPGSSRGLNYLLNRSAYAGWSQEHFNDELCKVREVIVDKLEIRDLTLHDVQNCMCEFSKYCRAALGEGKPKTTYNPEKEF